MFNFISEFGESWLKSARLGSGNVDIYINPTSSDYAELNKKGVRSLRFLADDQTKNVYVADAFDIIHGDLADKVSKTLFNKFVMRDTRVLFGTSSVKGSSSIMTNSDEIEGQLRDLKRFVKKNDEFQYNSRYGYIKLIVNHDWSWVNKYIQVNDWIRKFKSKFDLIVSQAEN